MNEDRKNHGRSAATENRAVDSPDHRVLRLVRESLGAIRYGQLVLTIHDGVVVQFDKVEKLRLR